MAAGLMEAVSFFSGLDLAITGTSIIGIGLAILIPRLMTKQKDDYLTLILPMMLILNTIGIKISMVALMAAGIGFIYVTFTDLANYGEMRAGKAIRKAVRRTTGLGGAIVGGKSIRTINLADRIGANQMRTNFAPKFIRDRVRWPIAEDTSDIEK